MGEQKDGLYFYRGVHKIQACQSKVENQLNLWHRRMGHTSFRVIQTLLNIGEKCNSERENKICEVCEKSKHTRDKFTLSNNKSSNVFDLIHCHLWGPYRTTSSCGASYFLTLVDDYSRVV